MKIQVLEKLSKLDSCFYQTVLSLARKNKIFDKKTASGVSAHGELVEKLHNEKILKKKSQCEI